MFNTKDLKERFTSSLKTLTKNQPSIYPKPQRSKSRCRCSTVPAEEKADIHNKADVAKYLEKYSLQDPIYEGYGCKDINKTRSLERFRRRYFVLYEGVLLYYKHKSNYQRDKRNGLKKSRAIVLEDLFLTKSASSSNNTGFSFYLHVPHELNKRHKILIVVHNKGCRQVLTERLQEQNPKLLTPSNQEQ